MPFKNKVVLVTGASRDKGIGRAIMNAFGEANATVIGTATTLAGTEKITQHCRAAGLLGGGMQLDVTASATIPLFIEQIKTQFGPVNILINNAATTRDNLCLRMSEEQWLQVIDVNLNSVYRMSKICLREMLKAKWGRIINISSIVGLTGNIGQVNYATAKAGMIGFTKSLAMEVATRGITVNTVAPGFIETNMTESISEKQRIMIKEHIPMQRFGQGQDVAGAVVFLASLAASYITGATIPVDGGMSSI